MLCAVMSGVLVGGWESHECVCVRLLIVDLMGQFVVGVIATLLS